VRPHISLGYKPPAPEAIVTGNKTKAVPGQLEISGATSSLSRFVCIAYFLNNCLRAAVFLGHATYSIQNLILKVSRIMEVINT
jgi:hypothetical protein